MRKGLLAAIALITLVALLGCTEAGAAKGWTTDFRLAVKAAQKTGRYLLLDFSGSDWCGWCVRLDREVFSKKEFKDFSEKNLVCVTLDFPRRKPQARKLRAQNQMLKNKYGVRGFPTVIILSPKGELAGRTGYRPGGPKPYVGHLKALIDAHKAKVSQDEKKTQ